MIIQTNKHSYKSVKRATGNRKRAITNTPASHMRRVVKEYEHKHPFNLTKLKNQIGTIFIEA